MKNYNIKITLLFLIIMLFFNSFSYAQEQYKKINAFEINGVITDATLKYVKENIEKSEKENAAVLIYIDTPGGVLESTRNIVQAILSSKVPVITYVYPKGARAASAGMFITIAGNYALMSESTNIGAAHPVASSGEDIKGEMEKKVLNDTVALAKNIAEKRGRNTVPVVAMVKESASYTSKEALDLKVIDKVAGDENIISLLPESLNISKDAVIEKVEPDFTQVLYNIIADPNILAVLLFIGIALILLEIKVPGTFIFGTFGVVSLIIFAYGANIIPINFLGIGLIILGFALIVGEVFITSFGLLTLGSIVSFVFGLRVLFDSEKSAGVTVSMWVIIIIIGLLVSIALLIGRLIIKDFSRKPIIGLEAMEGLLVEVIEWDNVKHTGKVSVKGEIWNAVCNDEVNVGDKVRVVWLESLTLHVEKNNE